VNPNHESMIHSGPIHQTSREAKSTSGILAKEQERLRRLPTRVQNFYGIPFDTMTYDHRNGVAGRPFVRPDYVVV
jgi:hypothetical protein